MPQPVTPSASGTDGREDRVARIVSPPVLSLPTGGGAVRSIGESFRASPATGTGSLTVPLAISPGRDGFGPELSLSYDSGAGNGPFGFGWTLNASRVQRKTDRALPRYDDGAETDTFVLSGADDLVPVLRDDSTRFEERSADGVYTIHRYRPRSEGAFARIERWTRLADGDVHWRSFSASNVLTLFGSDAKARIADPTDPRRIAAWCISEMRDDKGNAVLYEYKPEDGAGVNVAEAHQRNRGEALDPRRRANRYLKRILYGNRTPMLDADGRRPAFLSDAQRVGADWMFEVVLDYGEHDRTAPLPAELATWPHRVDAFSSYRFGFELRTARRCRRVLMFHHFDGEAGIGRDCLVRSTDFTYADELTPPDPRAPIHSFLHAVVERGYRRAGASYITRSLPTLEFEYSQPVIQDTVEDVDPQSLEHLPGGLDPISYRWADLYGEGIPGLLTEQGGAWFYKRNVSPIGERRVELGASERVALTPNASLADAQLVDLRGDGRLALALLDVATPGFYAPDDENGWSEFQPFAAQLTRGARDPNTRLVDLDGDGRADVLITEDDVFVWHASLGEEGYGPAARVAQGLDEEQAPRLVFADPAQSIYVADLDGDGLADLVRIRNGEVSYWPNLGYGRFGAKVAMDHAPQFDRPDQFDQRRIRVADIDGSGTADIIYLGAAAVTLYFNQSGNGWSDGQRLATFPPVDQIAAIQVADLLGNGTACLVWSSPLPAASPRPVRYVDLMGGLKPHLLVRVTNNLGGETHLTYAPSTRFALADRLAGRPWITKLPFPVHVVERVEMLDRISGNRFVTRYAYHHGHFDGVDREFRGFGMVEQWDTEQIDALPAGSSANISPSSHVPPVLTRTWFHTGLHMGREHVSNFFAGLGDTESGEYYREPGLSDEAAARLLLPDSELPTGLLLDEERQACRALRGVMLRREVYALDGGAREPHPYTVTEQTFAVRLVQQQGVNRHAVFFTHPREALTYNYEREPSDPRVAHTLTIDVDGFGNVLAAAAIAYGRRTPDPSLAAIDRQRQAALLVTASEHAFTIAIDSPDAYRTPLPCESRCYEIGGVSPQTSAARVTLDQMVVALATAISVPFEDSLSSGIQKRLIGQTRTRYRPDDLGVAAGSPLALLPLGTVESLAIPGEQVTLAFTAGLVSQRFGDKVEDARLAEAGYVHDAGDNDWWQPSGRAFLSPDPSANAASELSFARRHFFHPHRFRDPFHRAGFETESTLTYDDNCLLIVETRDARDNVVAARPDYRVLRPSLVTDANGNRIAVAFDALGMVTGTAVMGKVDEAVGDSLDGFDPDLDEAVVRAHLLDPLAAPHELLQRATTRQVYDLLAPQRSAEPDRLQPAATCTLARETHDADLGETDTTRVQKSITYVDGVGREIQKKSTAPPDSIDEAGSVAPRWICSGWVVHNNKGLAVRRFEPFFSATPAYEGDHREGVSATVFYDPIGRAIAALHPDHSWEKTLAGAWRGEQWDANDTVLLDPSRDADVGDHFGRLSEGDYSPTWHAQRAAGQLGPHEQAAAVGAAVYETTPTVTHFDALGRTVVSVVHNRTTRTDRPDAAPQDSLQATRFVHDIDGHQTGVIDALGRTIGRHDYNLAGICIHSAGIDAGERWVLNDVAGRVIDRWDSLGQRHRVVYDVLGRSLEELLLREGAAEIVVSRTSYGEDQPDAESRNLRAKAFQVSDAAGVLTTLEYDFKGNALVTSRQLCTDYTAAPDWSAPVALDTETHTSLSTFDALNRLVRTTSADGSTVRRRYDEAGHITIVDANIAGEMVNGEPSWRVFMASARANARGQREHTVLGNGVVTTRDYDPLTFRLRRVLTVSAAGSLQDLSYTYDPVGNLTHVEDAAQQTIYFRNTVVGPGRDYLYDATYQLIEATGREHLGQLNGQANPPAAPGAFEPFQTELEHPGDGLAMGRYVERYEYDAVGNLLAMRHTGSDPAHPGWTRQYSYELPGAIDPGVTGNQLSRTQVGDAADEPYTYDAHGSMTRMPHLSVMTWNDRDLLASSSRQSVSAGTPETTWYVYDSSGRRIRKVTERAAGPGETPVRASERIYLGGSEIYREYGGDGVAVTLERQTLYITGGTGRLALVERRTAGDDGSALELSRYQIADHLNSVSAEVDGDGRLISYEEYFPFGATSYHAVDSSLRAAARRYRYSAMERDEETGLACHGQRYVATWLGRWISADPVPAINVYAYADNRPLIAVDVTGAAPAYMSEQDRKWWSDAAEGWEAGPLPNDAARIQYQEVGANTWQRDATAQEVTISREGRTIIGAELDADRAGDAATTAERRAQSQAARTPGASSRPYDATPGAPMRDVGIRMGYRPPEPKPWPSVDMAEDWVGVDTPSGNWSRVGSDALDLSDIDLSDMNLADDALVDAAPASLVDELGHVIDPMDAPLPLKLLKRTGKTIFKAVPLVGAGIALSEAEAYASKGNYRAAGLTLAEEIPSPPTVAMATGHMIADLGDIASEGLWAYWEWCSTSPSTVDQELAKFNMDPDERADLEAGLMEWNGEEFVYINIGGERP